MSPIFQIGLNVLYHGRIGLISSINSLKGRFPLFIELSKLVSIKMFEELYKYLIACGTKVDEQSRSKNWTRLKC